MPQGKAVIGQSGGPTAVINRSLVGFIKEATKSDFDDILGAKHGLEGMLKEDFVDLSNLSEAQLYGIGKTPAAALGSVRKKPTDSDIENLVSIFESQNIRNFFYIGGNDSAETANLVSEGAKSIGYEMKEFHIPKLSITIYLKQITVQATVQLLVLLLMRFRVMMQTIEV